MSAAILFPVITIILLSFRLLHLASQAMPPVLHFTDSELVRSVLALCPLLVNSYVPPVLWGKNGHLQTLITGTIGRFWCPPPCGERHHVQLSDGATMTFDVFESRNNSEQGDPTLCVCPGFANSSVSPYLHSLILHAHSSHFRVAVLNHLGAPEDVPLTSSRIFNYGNTEEFGTMIDRVRIMFPNTHLIAVGLSMGGNIVTKYIGESKENQDKILCGISCGQGYDLEKAMEHLSKWKNFRCCYLWLMSKYMKSLMKRNMNTLFGMFKREYDTKRIFSARSIVQIDEHYGRKHAGFSSVRNYYSWASCVNHLDKIEIPMLFLNAMDDPLMTLELLEIPHTFVHSRSNIICAETRHGGHLGYFQGGLLIPDTVTWLDKMVIQYSHAMVQLSTQ